MQNIANIFLPVSYNTKRAKWLLSFAYPRLVFKRKRTRPELRLAKGPHDVIVHCETRNVDFGTATRSHAKFSRISSELTTALYSKYFGTSTNKEGIWRDFLISLPKS